MPRCDLLHVIVARQHFICGFRGSSPPLISGFSPHTWCAQLAGKSFVKSVDQNSPYISLSNQHP